MSTAGNNADDGVAEANGREVHEEVDEAERMEEDDADGSIHGDEDAESEDDDDDDDEDDEHYEEKITEAHKNVKGNPYDYNGHLNVSRLS